MPFRSWVNMMIGILLFSLALSQPALAGSNQDFTLEIIPREVRNPEIGQTINVVILAKGTSIVKGNSVALKYDPELLEFKSYAPGNITTGAIPLSLPPKSLDDGFNTVEGGTTIFSAAQEKTEGTLGIFTFEVIAELPDAGTRISAIEVEVNASADDTDIRTFESGGFGVKVLNIFPNTISDMEINRRQNSAILNWRTREPGINDTVLFRIRGEEAFQTAVNPLLQQTTPKMLQAVRILLERGLVPRETPLLSIREVLAARPAFEDVEITDAFINKVKALDDALGNRRHVVPLRSLEPNTEYEFIARSYDLNDRPSQRLSGQFSTRRDIDRRPLVIERFEIQTTPFSAVVRWFTNRPADTRYTFNANGEDTATETVIDEDGTQVHIVELRDLDPNLRYEISIGSRMTSADEFIASGLTESDVSVVRNDFFKTRRADRRLRFLGPPVRIISTDEARLRVRLNQPAKLQIDYAALEQGQNLRDVEPVYTDTVSSEELLESHDLVLSGLSAETLYRFRLTAFNSTDTLSTDPRGNQQWSRDLHYRTSAESDTLNPVIISGPQVLARGKVAVVRWATDVPTTGKVYLGTLGTDGTLGTSDEIEYADLSPNGSNRFAPQHIIVTTGLNLSTEYGYRIESTSANGKTVVFDPNNSSSAAKRAKVLQPPGGAGSFTTESTADTQFPVLLSGPNVSSQTHDSAVIEWTTDEPADSEIRFGSESLDEDENSGDNETSHKLVLSNLEAGTTYHYIVGSTDAAGNGATESSQATFTTDPEIDLTPPVITNPDIIYKNDETATISWTTDEESTAEVEFGTTETLGNIRTLSTTGENHTVTLTNLSANTTYYYTVSSADLSNNGPTVSDTLSFTTDEEADLLPPALSNIQTIVADSAAIITWNSDELADSYVEFGTDQNLLEFNVGDTEDVTEHDITLTNLTPGATYYYIVGSVDRSNNPPTESDTLNFTTLADADTTAPSAPFDLIATAGNRQIVLTWDATLELDLNGFNVYRRSGSDNFTLLASGQQKTAFTDLNVENDESYEYRITAIDRQNPPNESEASASVSTTPTSSAGPTTPTELSHTGDYLMPTLLFANSSPFNAIATVTYTIQVSTQTDFSDVTASVSGLAEGSGDVGTGQTGWTIDRQLEEGETYYWRVRAVETIYYDLIGAYSETEELVAIDPSSLAGDFNGDGAVTFDDFFLFVDYFGQPAEGEAEKFDLDGGGTVDFNDFFTFVDNFGKSVASKRWAASDKIDTQARFTLEAFGGTQEEQRRVTVHLWADQVQGLKAYGAVLDYDPNQVVFEGARPGPGTLIESQGGQAPLFQVLYQRSGQLVVGNGLANGEPVSGRGLLAELDFRLLGAGTEASFDLTEGYIASSGAEVRSVAQLNSARLVPRRYALFANFPNPFNPTTSIEYALPEAAQVELVIYDLLGQKVRTLVTTQNQNAGYYHLRWDGRNDAGHTVSSGMYFYRLTTPQFTHARKMILLK